MTRVSTPSSFVTVNNTTPFKDKHMSTKTRPDAAKAAPEHPIRVPGRFTVVLAKQWLLPNTDLLFFPGFNYTVDTATKTLMDTAKVLKVATPA